MFEDFQALNPPPQFKPTLNPPPVQTQKKRLKNTVKSRKTITVENMGTTQKVGNLVVL